MPSSPFTTAPGTRAKASHTESVRPSVWPAPSIWKAAVAAPQRKPWGSSTRPLAVARLGDKGVDGTNRVMSRMSFREVRGTGGLRGAEPARVVAGAGGAGSALDGALHDARDELATGEDEDHDQRQRHEEDPRHDERVVDEVVRLEGPDHQWQGRVVLVEHDGWPEEVRPLLHEREQTEHGRR